MFYGLKYTKALQDILNTEGGKTARGMIRISTPALSGKIETYSQARGRWNKSSLEPRDAAITSVAIFGMDLEQHGQTPEERLAGNALQLALIDYSGQNPSAKTACAAVLMKWEEVHHAAQRTSATVTNPEGIARSAFIKSTVPSAANFTKMQYHYLSMFRLVKSESIDGSTVAAFAYGVLDSALQHLDLSDDDFYKELKTYTTLLAEQPNPLGIKMSVTDILYYGSKDAQFQEAVVTGGQAFRDWLNGPKGDWVPCHLERCLLALIAKKGRSR